MSDAKVIDLKSRKPFAVARAEEKKDRRRATRKARKNAADAVIQHRESLVECLEKLLVMVREGRLEGLVLLARETSTKLFLTEVLIDDRVIVPNDLHAFVGVVETLKLEIADIAAATAPCLMLDGSTCDPMAEPLDEDWEYEV